MAQFTAVHYRRLTTLISENESLFPNREEKKKFIDTLATLFLKDNPRFDYLIFISQSNMTKEELAELWSNGKIDLKMYRVKRKEKHD